MSIGYRPLDTRNRYKKGIAVAVLNRGTEERGTLISVQKSKIPGVPSRATVNIDGTEDSYQIMGVFELVELEGEV